MRRLDSACAGQHVGILPETEQRQREKYAEDPDTGLNWAKASVDVWVSRSAAIKDLKKLWDYASEMYGASCGSCHNLTAPDHSLANQWPGTLEAMKRFIALDEEELRFVQKYLQFHAKDTGGQK